MDWLGSAHFAAAVTSMIAGGVVCLVPKGTRAHRRVGWLYVTAMAAVNGTALLIYDLFGRFGPFHVAALLSGLTLIGGIIPARRRFAGWMSRHAYWMAGSYVGLLAAAASEVSTRWLDLPFGATVAVATVAVVALGFLTMLRTIPDVLFRFGPRRGRQPVGPVTS